MNETIGRRAFVTGSAAVLATPAIAAAAQSQETDMAPIEHINPESMHRNPAFSQGIIIPANARILIIGGQNAVDANGEVIGKGDIAAQTARAVENLVTVLETAGGSLDDLVRVGLFIREDADLGAGFGAWMASAGGRMTNPPTVTSAIVAKLAHPDFLIEIEATAVLK